MLMTQQWEAPMAERTGTNRVNPAALATTLRDSIVRLNRRLRQVRPVGDLTQSQLSALTSLELAGEMTPRELAEAERVQPPTMTKIIAKLEDRGLVRRDRHPTDGRQALLARPMRESGSSWTSVGPRTSGWHNALQRWAPASATRSRRRRSF